MSKNNGNDLGLTGTGVAYVRVSTDQQDTERQYASIHSFEQRHHAPITNAHWFKDEGWARDKADHRPDFQRLMKLAEARRVQWIVVDALDRFGTKDAHQLVHYLYRLRECGCRLYDTSGKEWTGEDIGTIITAVVEGEKSKGEQTSKSRRVLGGKVAKARDGEWQGGPVRLGFDVVCYLRESGKELWRVIFEGRDKRLKVYPDGRKERFDGKRNFPKCQEQAEVLRVAPSKDKAKVAAAVSVFSRYATEAIGFTDLAHYLNQLGFRNSCGGAFHPHRIESMLEDPIFLGYYTWNKTHFGKFHRFKDGQTVLELNYDEKLTKNAKADWVQSRRRLFDPLVDLKTWNAVQRKLAGRSRRANAPRSATQYLAGLLYCGNCGGRMVAGPTQRGLHYFCGTYHKAVREKKRGECKCLRNAVTQEGLEEYIGRYLEETGKRLELLTQGTDGSHLTDRLQAQEAEAWTGFRDGIARLTAYLAEHHPAEYNAILREQGVPQEEGGPGPDDFVDACVQCYRANFDPSTLTAEVERLEAEHSNLMSQWADLPTPRAKEKAREQFASLEARIQELRRQQEDAAGVVATHYREMLDLQQAIAEAKMAMRSETGERALRQRAEAVRAVVHRIECTFEATGHTKGGPGRKNSRLAKVVIYPVAGEARGFSANSDKIRELSVHSL